MKLTYAERRALEILVEGGGSVLVARVPDETEREVVFGGIVPDHPVYRKLEKRKLVWYVVEEPLNLPVDPLDGFQLRTRSTSATKGAWHWLWRKQKPPSRARK